MKLFVGLKLCPNRFQQRVERGNIQLALGIFYIKSSFVILEIDGIYIQNTPNYWQLIISLSTYLLFCNDLTTPLQIQGSGREVSVVNTINNPEKMT